MNCENQIPRKNGMDTEKLVIAALRQTSEVEVISGTNLIDLKVDGVWVEVKSCVEFDKTGRRGRFIIKEEQHEFLLQNGGYYAFIVTCSDGSVRMKMVSPSEFEYTRKLVWTKVIKA